MEAVPGTYQPLDKAPIEKNLSTLGGCSRHEPTGTAREVDRSAVNRRQIKTEYVHQELNQEITAIGGYYVLVKEARLPFHGREVLYLVGHAAFDSTCCGAGGCAYALVPGFVLAWKSKSIEDGLAVSAVEPIRETGVQEQVRRLIEGEEIVQQVTFL